jgi:hypothetical protein
MLLLRMASAVSRYFDSVSGWHTWHVERVREREERAHERAIPHVRVHGGGVRPLGDPVFLEIQKKWKARKA